MATTNDFPTSSVPFRALCTAERHRSLRPDVLEVATDPGFALWPNRRIPYQIITAGGDISPAFSDTMKNTIEMAIDNWNVALRGRVRFVPKTQTIDQGFLNIWRIPDGTPGGNWADIGFGRGQRNMWLFDNQDVGRVHHELGHVLGLHHEHMRPDRDLFLNVFENQVPIGSYADTWGQMIAKKGTAIGPYDYNSVMHYPSDWDRPNLRLTSTVRDNNGGFVPAIGGTIKETTSHGWVTRIDWDNGVILGRSDPGPLPNGLTLFELSGTWQSNIGVEYIFNQMGLSFTWRATSLGQQGEGTIQTWTETSGTTSIRVFEDKTGAPVNPNWNVISPETANGVIQMYA